MERKKILKICRQVLTSFSRLQNRSFCVLDRTRTAAKCTKMKNARAKRTKLLLFFICLFLLDMQICIVIALAPF